MYLGAIVVLPEGFDAHPDARYPLMINHGHFTREMRGFPPDLGSRPGVARSSSETGRAQVSPG